MRPCSKNYTSNFDEDYVFNAEMKDLVLALNYGRTLARNGDKGVKFGDVVRGGVGMTVMNFLGNGSKERLKIPFMIFQNDIFSHNMKSVLENVSGVCYRSGNIGG